MCGVAVHPLSHRGRGIAMGIEIQGVDRIIAKLGKIEGVNALMQPMQESVMQLQAAMQVYPPALPTSRYVRTGTLGRRWTTRVTRSGEGLTGRVGNNTIYAPVVQSDMFQARPFVGRWTTDAQAIERLRPWIVGRFQRRIAQVLEGR